MGEISVAVVLTVHNRIEKTKKCLDSILQERCTDKLKLSFFITDDGSDDGTAEVLEDYQKKNPDVPFTVLQGSGKLFWNKGMHLSYGRALSSVVDYYLWVNNDVVFEAGFLSQMISDYMKIEQKKSIICGSVCKTGSQELSYGGSIQQSWVNPYKREYVIPCGRPQRCDCVNGNCLLIPYDVAQELGNVEEYYEHGFGDFDYGYRLLKAGGSPYVASHYVGACNRNEVTGSWKDASLPFKERIRKKNYPTGQPLKSHRFFLKKWFPLLWPYYLYKPYVRIFVTSIMYKMTK